MVEVLVTVGDFVFPVMGGLTLVEGASLEGGFDVRLRVLILFCTRSGLSVCTEVLLGGRGSTSCSWGSLETDSELRLFSAGSDSAAITGGPVGVDSGRGPDEAASGLKFNLDISDSSSGALTFLSLSFIGCGRGLGAGACGRRAILALSWRSCRISELLTISHPVNSTNLRKASLCLALLLYPRQSSTIVIA